MDKRRKKLKRLIFLFVFILFIIPINVSYGSDYTVDIEGRWFSPDLKGKLKVSEAGFEGTEIDLEKDLGMDNEDFGEFRATLRFLKRHWIRFAYLPVKFDGDKFIQRDIVFNGKTYSAGTRVKSQLDTRYYRIGYGIDIISRNTLKAGMMIDGKVLDISEASLEAPDAGLKEEESVIGGIPTPGIFLAISPVKMISIYGEVSGAPLGRFGYAFDGEAGVGVSPVKFLSINGGYRIIKINIKTDDDRGKLDLFGPYAGLSIRF